MGSIVQHIQDLIDEHGSWENYLKTIEIQPMENPCKNIELNGPDQMFRPDSIVQAIADRFINRAKFGWNKYGTNLDRKDLSTTEWVQHLQDELHDAYVYSEKLKQDEIKRNRLLDLFIKNSENVSATHEPYEWLPEIEAKEMIELKLWYAEQKNKKAPDQAKPTSNQNY
jgi:hypothetical protein